MMSGAAFFKREPFAGIAALRVLLFFAAGLKFFIKDFAVKLRLAAGRDADLRRACGIAARPLQSGLFYRLFGGIPREQKVVIVSLWQRSWGGRIKWNL